MSADNKSQKEVFGNTGGDAAVAEEQAAKIWSRKSYRARWRGAKVVRPGRYVTFQLAEVAVPRNPFREILRRIDELRRRPVGRGNRRRGESDRRGASGWREK